MEYNFRTALIVISAVVITAIFVHGFWTIRKNKNPYKLKAKSKTDNVDTPNRGFDGSGFDQDGVSKPRVVDNPLNDEVSHQEIPMPATSDYEEQATSYREFSAEDNEPSLGDMSSLDKMTQNKENHVPDLRAQEQSLFEQVKAEEPPVVKKVEKSLYQTPVTSAKPIVKTSSYVNKKAPIKRDQIEINFDDAVKKGPTSVKKDPIITKRKKVSVEPEVLIISVVMPENQLMSGAALLPTLLTLGMKYGDMNIFHRHEDNAGNGKVTFSLANIMNPGTFDLDNMESFTTQGISLFMTLPSVGEASVVFEQMLNAAKQLALEFSGQLLDDKRSVMTKQTEQHYTSKIREFERRNLIASA
ncbi:MAG: cell division protein ZipA [Colwellia sp.]|nr:cell division protein ZipA [Colwellia sp.]